MSMQTAAQPISASGTQTALEFVLALQTTIATPARAAAQAIFPHAVALKTGYDQLFIFACSSR